MAKTSALKSATFSQVLIFSDGPQLVLLDTAATSKVVAVAINKKGFDYPFLAAEVSLAQFNDYLAEKFDLRYLFLRADLKRHYIFDLPDFDQKEVSLAPFHLSEERQDRFLPEPGLFARHHTDEVENRDKFIQSTEIYNVDGSWDLPEFSRFYRQVSDIYSILNAIDLYTDDTAEVIDRRQVQTAFMKPFQGGGSYVSMYDQLLLAQPRGQRLRVGGIQYHSPGYVEIRGRVDPFREIRALIDRVEERRADIAQGYKTLHRLLKRLKLLTLSAEKFDKKSETAELVTVEGKRFSEVLGAVGWNELSAISGGNPLVAAKALLSLYRRATRLQEFFAQGRLSFPDDDFKLERREPPA